MSDASAPAATSRRARRWTAGLILAALAAAGAAVVFQRSHTRETVPPEPDPAAAAVEPGEVAPPPNPGYVGPQACAACHAQRVAEFRPTRHALACVPATPKVMPPGFAPPRNMLVSRAAGLRFEMERRGDQFLQTAVHASPTGERRQSWPLDLVYGSQGLADEVFFTWRGERLFELPMAWLHPFDSWALQPIDPHGNVDRQRPITARCLECHNTWVPHVPGTDNQYRRDGWVMGVTCEKCHGPGRDHVAYHQEHPKERARDIVHPARLTREQNMDLCAQCHSNVNKRRGPAFSYLPGDPLAAHFRTAKIKHREDDRVIDQAKYLRMSKCFQKSDMTCTTCHNPHRPAEPAAAQRSCQKCHQPADCHERPRLPAAVRDNCVGCHMPRFTRIQVQFHTADDQYVAAIRPHDHRIAVHPTAQPEVLLEWRKTQQDEASRKEVEKLTKTLVEHWLGEVEQFRREHRFMAAIAAAREALRFDPSPAVRGRLQEVVSTQAEIDRLYPEAMYQFEKGNIAESVGLLNRVLRLKPDLARAHGLLGTAEAKLGRRQQAIEHWQKAADYDPDDPGGWSMLGALALNEGRFADAAEAYRKADEIEPFSAVIKYSLGMSLARLNRWDEASKAFRKALEADPKHALAAQALSHSLTQLGRLDEALPFAERAARLSRFQNPHVLLTLAETYAAAGRPADAAATATKALDLPRTAGSPLPPQLRRQFEEIKSRAAKGR